VKNQEPRMIDAKELKPQIKANSQYLTLLTPF